MFVVKTSHLGHRNVIDLCVLCHFKEEERQPEAILFPPVCRFCYYSFTNDNNNLSLNSTVLTLTHKHPQLLNQSEQSVGGVKG